MSINFNSLLIDRIYLNSALVLLMILYGLSSIGFSIFVVKLRLFIPIIIISSLLYIIVSLALVIIWWNKLLKSVISHEDQQWINNNDGGLERT